MSGKNIFSSSFVCFLSVAKIGLCWFIYIFPLHNVFMINISKVINKIDGKDCSFIVEMIKNNILQAFKI